MSHTQAIDLVKSMNIPVTKWLDTGCGTGNLVVLAKETFPSTNFVLSDPSEKMLSVAKEKLNQKDLFSFSNCCTQELQFEDNSFDVVTAIQSHHYLGKEIRLKAVHHCYRVLKSSGVFITFENIRPLSEQGVNIGLERWKNFQENYGKTAVEAEKHIQRFGNEFFPITIFEHLNLLHEVGFETVELFWYSHMQAGFYGIK